MRKPVFCICENKDTDQLRGNLNPNFKSLAIFYNCTAGFMSDLVGNPEDRFSHNEASIIYVAKTKVLITQLWGYRGYRVADLRLCFLVGKKQVF